MATTTELHLMSAGQYNDEFELPQWCPYLLVTKQWLFHPETNKKLSSLNRDTIESYQSATVSLSQSNRDIPFLSILLFFNWSQVGNYRKMFRSRKKSCWRQKIVDDMVVDHRIYCMLSVVISHERFKSPCWGFISTCRSFYVINN